MCTGPGTEPGGMCHNISRTASPQLLCATHKRHLSEYGEFRLISRPTIRKLNAVPCAGTEKLGKGEKPCTREAVYACPFPMCSTHKKHYNDFGKLLPLRGVRSKILATTRDAEGHKHCNRCRQWLPEDQFGPYKSQPDGLTNRCRNCLKDVALERLYGITRQQYDEMARVQGNACAICRTPADDTKRMHVDHDHACCPGVKTCGNCLRGLVCNNCNAGLGFFRDSESLLYAASAYLTRSRVARTKGEENVA